MGNNSSVIIKKIDVLLVKMELLHPFTTSFGTYQSMLRPFVKITTVDGYVGYGEVPTLTDPAYKAESDTYSVTTSLERFILPALKTYQDKHKGFATVNSLRESYAWIKGANFAKSGVECAFWDILAQKQKKPLWQMWGGTKKEFMVGVSIGGKTVEDILDKADHAVSLGYKRLKVKIWPGFEKKAVKALRHKYPKILLQVDANSSYTLKNWQLLQGLDRYDLLLIEQPLYDDDIIYHSEIAKQIKTPLCLDESIHSLDDVKRAIVLWKKNNILPKLIINIKPPRVSGFQEAIDIAKFCHKKGVKTWIGGMLDSGWGKAFNLNLNSLKEITLPGDHFPPIGSYFKKDVVQTPLTCKDGYYILNDDKISNGLVLDANILKSLGKKILSFVFI